MGFARDFARFGVRLACISSALWTEPTETTIAQTPGSEEPEYGIATPPRSLLQEGAWGVRCVEQGFSTRIFNKDFQHHTLPTGTT